MTEIARVQCTRHRYPDQTEVSICGLDFTILEKQKVVILGPNGSGKTTLLLHLMGLLKPHEGKVRVFEQDPALNFEQIRKQIGVVFQNVDEQLIAPTVYDDITFTPRNYNYPGKRVRRMANSIMEQTGITHLATKIPHYLSGGEKKKVALAGAMIMHPKLLILDEPFEGLDPRSKYDILQLLNKFNRENGTSIVVSAHDVNLVPLFADQTYVLTEGKIILSGTPYHIFSNYYVLKKANLEPPIILELIDELNKHGIHIHPALNIESLTRVLVHHIKAA